MLTKCQYDTYAYYDLWGNRYLIFTHKEYCKCLRHIEYRYIYYISKISV